MYKTDVKAFDEAFEFLTGDVCWEDHGGKWCRQVSPSRFHVVSIFNWEETTGEEDGPTYHLDISEVDTDDADRVSESLKSCGYEMEADGTIFIPYSGDVLCEASDEKTRRLILCECMHGYGAHAPLEAWDGDGLEPLFANAAKVSKNLSEDAEAYEAAMNRPVNALGSTAREYAQGDIKSPMMRGLSRGDQASEIMTIMYFGRDNLEPIKELSKLMHPAEGES